MIRKVLGVLRPDEKRRMATLMLLDIVISIADIAFLAALLFLVSIYTEQKAPAGKFTYLASLLTGRNALSLILLFFFLFSIKNMLGFLIYRAQCKFAFRVASRISRNKLVNYLEGNYSGYTDIDSSVHVREISYQPQEFCQHVLGGFQQMVTQSVLIVLSITGVIFFNARLFLLILLIILPPVLLLFYILKRKMRSIRGLVRTKSQKSLQYLQEALSGFVESNIYHKNKVFLNRYLRFQDDYNRYLSDHTISLGIPSRTIEIFFLMGIVILIAISRWSGDAGNGAITTLGVFMVAAYKIIPGIVKLLGTSGQINAYAFTVQGLAMARQPARETTQTASEPRAADPIRHIRFRDVSFSYDGRPVLDRLSFDLATGDFVGIHGPSGKGKTTILNLLLGFLSPEKGDILFNDQIADETIKRHYWQRVSYVKQQSFLLHDTLLYNITLNGEKADRERLRCAIEVAGVSGLIESLPDGLDHVIAENGRNISGGQRQRIAIARALYRNTDLVILDEPFTELDEPSELALLRYFQQLSKAGKIIILITHNLHSLSFCSKTVSLYE